MSLVGEQDAKYVYQAPSEWFGRHSAIGTNVGVVLTMAAPGGILRNSYNYLHWSFDAVPTAAATLTITDGSVTQILHITNSGPGYLPYEGIAFAENVAVTVTLSAGGVGVTGSVSIIGARAI